MFKRQSIATTILLGLLIVFTASAQNNITNYHPVFIAGTDQNDNIKIAIRDFQMDNSKYLLTVNPNTLQTEIISAQNFTAKKINQKKLIATPYFSLLKVYSQPPYKLQNYGITHALQPVNGMFLTTDLCPSTKPITKEIYTAINGPIGIAITGKWLLSHEADFNWLITQKNLQITWVNHSFSHPYQPKNTSLRNNFLLAKPENFNNEVLSTEELLIANNQTPSVYFRFPGLVSDKNLVKKLTALGLIPLGADAWLAKDEDPTNGSIILVHGNGNEPKGVTLLLKLFSEQEIKLLALSQLH